ncbi:MAG: carboxypeptidase regulatory-like domain-containing protein [Chloroflexi bacterium]|nr:MAG: carboxypeptidase regulatory-like domain-containing protein [Chloroflexota bacterium]
MRRMRARGISVWRALLGLICATAMVGATGFMVTPVRVSGRVVDIYGQPVPNAQVSLAANIGPDASTHTATDGSFALAGGYRVAGIQVDITAPGFLPLQQHGSGLAVLDRAPMVHGRRRRLRVRRGPRPVAQPRGPERQPHRAAGAGGATPVRPA